MQPCVSSHPNIWLKAARSCPGRHSPALTLLQSLLHSLCPNRALKTWILVLLLDHEQATAAHPELVSSAAKKLIDSFQDFNFIEHN